MICREVKRVVYFFLDGSLGEKSQQDVNQHLSRCPECGTRLEVQRRLRTFLRSRFARLTAAAPDHLRTRLSRSIRAFRAEWSQP
jgi:mycothiol system anti-sigma-R factor